MVRKRQVAISVEMVSPEPSVALVSIDASMSSPIAYSAQVAIADLRESVEVKDAAVSLVATETMIDVVVHPV